MENNKTFYIYPVLVVWWLTIGQIGALAFVLLRSISIQENTSPLPSAMRCLFNDSQ